MLHMGQPLHYLLNIIFFTSISDQYPTVCERECRCYVNPHERALVVDCARADLTQIPQSLPSDTDWLILSENNITSFQVTVLQFLPDLRKLQLQNNKIKSISEDFVQYLKTHHNLADLDISNNKLKVIPRNLMPNFLMTLKLSGNRFKCTCNNVWMKKWLIDSREVVQDYKAVDCQMESGHNISFIELTDADLACASMFVILKSKLFFTKHKEIMWQYFLIF